MRVGEEDELGQIEKGVGGGKELRKREKEAQAGHPHIAHSYLIWLSFPYSPFHDSLCSSPQKQPKAGSAAAVSVNSNG